MADFDSTEPPTISPTVGRRWLAQELRRLREAAGLKQADVARRLRCNPAKVGHMETMRNAISGPDLEVVLPFLGVPAERVGWYLQLADVAKEKGWWDGNQAIPEWFSLYIGLEWGASEIREWDLGFIPGILQTRAYAEGLLRSGDRAGAVGLTDQVDARLQRQGALGRGSGALSLHAIVDESVLHRAVGDGDVMRDQLRHLVASAEHRQAVLQVMPLSAGPHRGQLGSFSWLGFPRVDDVGVVYVENQRGGLFLEDPDEIESFQNDFECLREKALAPDDSKALLVELAGDAA
ncbi:helix-turn-helix transcriptional regulator [Saccharopolyspora sp. NFXS83]|uniref:helix-turn-helix domain-containing protein n=1 Tax=Saccharopolyspora sp. NFXS83 TaxID=2993560 RepID=UPI00224B6857|nr:helix-turn-helix transcriptional regulator [Saccharopolyspora sp. NFXS83]MCX2730765.1 helix-turn-helix transcriptional regulator [Saccharopolyspora sp. NFXS83]